MNFCKTNKTILLLPVLLNLPLAGQVSPLSISDALAGALQNNYSIIISRAQTDIASVNNSWGTAGRYPSIGFDAGSANTYDLEDQSTNSRLTTGLGLNWTIFNGFRANITKQKLEELERLAGGQAAVVIENTIEDVILAYYNVLLQQESLEILKKVMNLSKDRYDYERTRHELGGSVTYNVLLAKNVYLSDKARFMNQEVVVRNALRDLNFLMGEEPSANWSLTELFEPDTTAYQLDELLNRMMSDNQVLKNQYANLLLKQREVELKKSGLYPSLRLSSGLDLGSARSWTGDNNDPLTSSSKSAYGNLSLGWTLYNGGNRRSDIQIARISQEMARVETKEMEHHLTNLLLNIHDFYTVRKALLVLANENLAAAELNLRIADEKFRSGVINSFNYRDIQLIYMNAALDRLEAISNLIDSRTLLTRLTGGFLSAEPAGNEIKPWE